MPNAPAGNIGSSLYVDNYLTNYSLNWTNDNQEYIAGVAASRIPVSLQSSTYVTYDRGYFLRDEMELRPLGGKPVQVGYKTATQSYFCQEYALEHNIDDRQRANVGQTPQINLDMNATRLLTGKSLIKRDRTWANTFFKSGAWTFDLTGVASAPGANQFLQFDQAGANPIDVMATYIDAMAQSTGFRPNTLVLGTRVARKLKTQAVISSRIQYTRIGVADTDLLTSLFFGDVPDARTVVGRSIYNANAEGLTPDYEFIMPANAMWLGYIDRGATLDSPTAIGLFAWQGLLNGAANANGGVITRGREDRAYSDWFHIRDAWDMRIISPDLGVFFTQRGGIMAYEAVKNLKFGDGYLSPGDPVPVEAGRDYQLMLRTGDIKEVPDAEGKEVEPPPKPGEVTLTPTEVDEPATPESKPAPILVKDDAAKVVDEPDDEEETPEEVDLREQAKVVGLTVDKRWSDDTLRQKIADAKAAQETEQSDGKSA